MKTRYCEDHKYLYRKCLEKDEKRILDEELNNQPERLSPEDNIDPMLKVIPTPNFNYVIYDSLNSTNK
jgi:hypothetical protein